MEELELELKRLIVEVLMIDDLVPEEIDSDTHLFREGVGLDSVDALELAKCVSNRYGVHLGADDEKNRQIFASVRSLAAYIAETRGAVNGGGS